MLQRYVANELTHFVGASLLPDEPAQYALLCKILRAGWLGRSSPAAPFAYALSPVANDLGESLSAEVVCFCDIPVEDLQLHSSKYGRFGVAFKKDYLARKGATPVFYVVKDAPTLAMPHHIFAYDRPVGERGPHWSQPPTVTFGPARRGELFEVWKYATIRMSMEADRSGPPNARYEFMSGPWWSDFREFFSLYFFGYVKYMAVGLADEDKRNFYMEREWRVLRGVSFELDDVSRILLPESFARTFRLDFPGYFGQISFVQ